MRSRSKLDSQGEPQATGGAPERTWGLRGGAGSRCRGWGPCRQGSGARRRLGGWPDHSRPTLGAGLWLPLLAALRIASRQTRREHAAPATWPCTPKAGEDPRGSRVSAWWATTGRLDTEAGCAFQGGRWRE